MQPITLFLQDLNGGGAERVMLQLANGLARRGRAVELLLVNPVGPYRSAVDPGVRVVPLGAGRTLAAVPAVARHLRATRPAALVAALPHVNVAAVLARALSGTGTPVILTEHSQPGQARRNARTAAVRLAHRLVPLAYRAADAVVAVSGGVAEELAALTGLPPRRIAVVPNAVVSDDLLRRAAEPVEHPWFADASTPVIVSCGRLAWPKDFGTLIRAFTLLRRERPARLMILGEGPDRAALEHLAAHLGVAGDVALPGFAGNPFAVMSRAAVFVLASVSEGMPTVLIEAMACGTPVIASDCTVGPRDLLEGGRLGRLVPVGDAEALSLALRATLDGRPDVEPARAKAWRHSVDNAVDAYLDVMSGCGGARRGSRDEAAGERA
ncbi:glycosyltransferase [Azospirillum sp.]|uniref:glycosyltransferase n=1 Tax=Azospirillum sp. TaxID=34012 RepID=UPI002D6EB643|nr:glycosyltransferase [Azospirillum sp.]HYD64654.1 glycosyltransferase [Azospirillum sp.]